MRSESQNEPTVDPSVRAEVPSCLMYFAIPPVITSFVLSAIEPMAGMALLTCFVVMSLVLRCLLWVEGPGRRVPADAEPFPHSLPLAERRNEKCRSSHFPLR
jgi:hypothetical protein